MKHIYIILILLILRVVAFSQDIHFSQFNASPLNLNSALTGVFDADYRLALNHKNQWSAVTTPYKTFSGSIDSKLSKYKYKNGVFGAGLLLNTDKAGDGDFGTVQVGLNLAYHYPLLADSTMVLSAGLAGTYNQISINYNKLNFNNQFDGGQYNSTLPSGEVFPTDQFSFFDVSLGANLYYLYRATYPVNIGVSWWHINRPERSFFENSSVKLNQKLNLNIGTTIEITENTSVSPSFLYMQQGKFHEFDLGGYVKTTVDNISVQTIYLGAWLRTRDAAIIMGGFDYKNARIGVSYDFNTSKLDVASGGRGGLELSLIYLISNGKSYKVPYYKQCPTFM